MRIHEFFRTISIIMNRIIRTSNMRKTKKLTREERKYRNSDPTVIFYDFIEYENYLAKTDWRKISEISSIALVVLSFVICFMKAQFLDVN